MTATGIPGAGGDGVLRIYRAPGPVTPILEHSDADQPSGTWAGPAWRTAHADSTELA